MKHYRRQYFNLSWYSYVSFWSFQTSAPHKCRKAFQFRILLTKCLSIFTVWYCWFYMNEIPEHFPLLLTISQHVQCVFQDDSITQATSGIPESIGDFNPFSATETVSCSFFTITTDGRHRSLFHHSGSIQSALICLFHRETALTQLSPSLLHPLSPPSCRPLWSTAHRWVRRSGRRDIRWAVE